MLIDKKVCIKWNARNKSHYIGYGYEYTKMGDAFEVDVEHLTKGSDAIVKVSCDYCNTIYEKHWNKYLKENKESFIKKDCCLHCRKYKIQEQAMAKYGVTSVFKLDETKSKIAKTNLLRYGSENPFQSEEIKERIYKTNISKYGFKSPMQNKDVLEKARKTCFEKYGVDFYVCNLAKSGSESPRWKGGISTQRNERATMEYINWRKKVYERDLYSCKCCGIKSGKGVEAKLQAHHIYNWKDYESLRYDVNNGITLCESCHMDFHKIYGKRDNNKQQIDEFLLNHGKKLC